MPNDDGIAGPRPRYGHQNGKPAETGEKRQELEPTKRTLYETLYGRLPFGDATTPAPAPVQKRPAADADKPVAPSEASPAPTAAAAQAKTAAAGHPAAPSEASADRGLFRRSYGPEVSFPAPARVGAVGLRVFGKPDLNAKATSWLDAGTVVTVLAREHTWLHIDHQGARGYAIYTYVELIRSSASSSPTPHAAADADRPAVPNEASPAGDAGGRRHDDAPVQARTDADGLPGTASEAGVHAAVAQGISTPSSSLPHRDTQAHTGPEAAASARAMHAGGGGGVQRTSAGAEPSAVSTPTPATAVTWDDITAAADDPPHAESVDLEWVQHLPAAIKGSIDLGYNEKDQESKFRASLAKDPSLVATDKPFLAEMAELENQIGPSIDPHWKPVTAGRPDPNKKATVDKLHADPTFQTKAQELEARHTQSRDAYISKARDAWDQRLVAYRATPHSRAQAPATQVRLRDARMAMRADFVGWAASVFGSVDAARIYFQGIQPVPDGGGMMLAATASKAFLSARSAFESLFPGYTFPKTSNGFALRELHRSSAPVGMLGHTLGQSFDFEAVDNPNQAPSVDGKPPDVNSQFMLRRFGGDPADPQSTGRNGITVPVEHATEVLGEQTGDLGSRTSEQELGKALDTMQVALKQFDEMAVTSARLKASMADQLPALRTARADYVDKVLKVQPQVDAAKMRLEAATKDARKKRLTGVDLDDAVAAEEAELKAVSAAYKAARSDIELRVQTAFKKWTDLLHADLAASHMRFTDAELASAAAIDVKTCDSVIAQVASARTPSQLNAIATKYVRFFDGLEPLPTVPSAGKKATSATTPGAASTSAASAGSPAASGDVATPEQRKTLMQERARHMRAITWERGEIATREDILHRIEYDLGFVFGTERDSKGKGIQLQVAHPPVTQYLERGFVRDDAMDTSKPPTPGAAKKQVFNRHVVEVLMQHGFSPGAAFPNVDSMHFDFIHGYNAAIANGGRGAKGTYAADGVTKGNK